MRYYATTGLKFTEVIVSVWFHLCLLFTLAVVKDTKSLTLGALSYAMWPKHVHFAISDVSHGDVTLTHNDWLKDNSFPHGNFTTWTEFSRVLLDGSG